MIDPKPLWDFSDPAASEARFREALVGATGPDRDVLLTQVARALGLQGRFADALALLDSIASDEPEVRVRVLLERGRVLRTSGDDDAAGPVFGAAVTTADEAGLEALAVDAMHMVALTRSGQDQVAATQAALDRARGSSDPGARSWTASLLNNLGVVDGPAVVTPAVAIPAGSRQDGTEFQFRGYGNTEGDNPVYFDDARGELQ